MNLWHNKDARKAAHPYSKLNSEHGGSMHMMTFLPWAETMHFPCIEHIPVATMHQSSRKKEPNSLLHC